MSKKSIIEPLKQKTKCIIKKAGFAASTRFFGSLMLSKKLFSISILGLLKLRERARR
jgi:hypothetical protein